MPGLPWLKNYEFDYAFERPWGRRTVVFTSVAGHLKSQDFETRYRKWSSCQPAELFEAPIVSYVDNVCWRLYLGSFAYLLFMYIADYIQEKKVIAKNIETQARTADVLFIWTDCDREGEHIGTEIRDLAVRINSRLEVKRARFSNIERACVPSSSSSCLIAINARPGTSLTRPATQSNSMSGRLMRWRRAWSWTCASAQPLRACSR